MGRVRTLKKVMISILFLTFILLGVLFYFKTYYPALPIDTVSKREAIEKVNNATDPIVRLTEENGIEYYISRMQQGKAYDHLKQMMSDRGFVFKEQMGAGYIFQKESEDVIVEGQMLSGKYVIFQIPLQ